jgi:C4-dicarboxylate transporter DctM subunit
MLLLAGAAFLALLLLAVPVAFTVGAAGFLGLWWSDRYPLAIVVQQMFQGVDSFVLLAIPLFVLAGALMETGGIARRLVRFAQALVGWVRGGLAIAVVIAEYIFSGISGSTIADVSAIGSTMIAPMTRAGYKPEDAVSVVAAASAMGILVPPCILMIVIGSIANVSVAALFAAGFVPALVLAAAIVAYIYIQARRGGMARPGPAAWGRSGGASWPPWSRSACPPSSSAASWAGW